MVVARHRAVEGGASLPDLVAYGSSQAHSSIEKGAKVAGYRHVRLVDVDDGYALRADELTRTVELDVASGLVPTVVTSTVGTTATTAVDPIREIADVARRYGMWHHVDAAYAGSAMLCGELRHHIDGVELVDSYVFNPHKWLLTNFDCSVFWVADRRPLIGALSIAPPYLRNPASESGQVIDYRDWHVPLGRRFRALKLWWVLRAYGTDGLQEVIRTHIAMAHGLAERLAADDRFELVAAVPFSLVCFVHRGGDEATERVAAHLNASGDVYVTGSALPDGRRFVRVAIGQVTTEQRHVDRAWDLIDQAG
jgi:aromatic-L-amino-acid decarboxylase